MPRCHNCGAAWVSEKKAPGPKEYCETCSAYLHCCLNCRFHTPGRHNECAIPETDWVGDRAGANFCDQFEFRDGEDGLPADDQEMGAAFKALFGDIETPRKAGPLSFDDLFDGD